MTPDVIRMTFTSTDAKKALSVLNVQGRSKLTTKDARIEAVIKAYICEHEKYIENRLQNQFDLIEVNEETDSIEDSAINFVSEESIKDYILKGFKPTLKDLKKGINIREPKNIAYGLRSTLKSRRFASNGNPLSDSYIANKITRKLEETINKIKDDVDYLKKINWTGQDLELFLEEFKKGNRIHNLNNVYLAQQRVNQTAIRAENSLNVTQVSSIIGWSLEKIINFNPENYSATNHYQAALAFGLLTGRRISEVYRPQAQYHLHALGIQCTGLSKKKKEDNDYGIFPTLADPAILVDFINTFPEKNKSVKQCESCASKLSEKKLGIIPQEFREWGITNHSSARKFYSSVCKAILSSTNEKGIPIANIPTHFLKYCMCHKFEQTIGHYVKFNIELSEELLNLKPYFQNYVNNIETALH